MNDRLTELERFFRSCILGGQITDSTNHTLIVKGKNNLQYLIWRAESKKERKQKKKGEVEGWGFIIELGRQNPPAHQNFSFSRLVSYYVSIFRSIFKDSFLSPLLLTSFSVAELSNCKFAAPRPLSPFVSFPAAIVVLGSSKSLVFTFWKADDDICFAGT